MTARSVAPVRVGRLLVGAFQTAIRQMQLAGYDVDAELTHRGLFGSHYILTAAPEDWPRVVRVLAQFDR